MAKLRRLQAEGAIQEQLAKGGTEKIGASHHFCDFHRRVISHHRQLISGNVVFTPNDKVPERKNCAGKTGFRQIFF